MLVRQVLRPRHCKLGKYTCPQRVALHQQRRVCIVGSGPSAFYCAKYILENTHVPDTHVDILEKLPVPFGLVRYGVAPDHPEVKNVTETFEQIGKNPRFRFFGNVCVGEDVSVQDLLGKYTAVVLAYGAESNKTVFGEYKSLNGILSAREFVNWYNGHPSYADYTERLELNKVKHVVIVGHGNVALDCARILTKSTDELNKTDIADHALAALRTSGVQTVTLLGRRGPVQSAFTIKEFRELTKLGQSVKVITDEYSFENGLSDGDSKDIYNVKRPVKRMIDLIKTTTGVIKYPSSSSNEEKYIFFRYLVSPVALLPREASLRLNLPIQPMDSSTILPACGKSLSSVLRQESEALCGNGNHEQRIGAVAIAENTMLPNEKVRIAVRSGGVHSVQESAFDCYKSVEVLPCDLLLTAVGYQSISLDASGSIPFDENRNVVPNNIGRVALPTGGAKQYLYAVGWVGRGPTGIIGTNIPDAKQTADSVVMDLKLLHESHSCPGPDEDPAIYITSKLTKNNKVPVSWDEYLKIDAEEKRRGALSFPKRPLVKVTSVDEMIKIAKS